MYFLAIVSRDNMNAGVILPAHTLCKTNPQKKTRSGLWIDNHFGIRTGKLPKFMIGDLRQGWIYEDFLSRFRTRSIAHGDVRHDHYETMKYYPEGALYWFECDQNGIVTGPAVFVKKVPIPGKNRSTDDGFQRLKQVMERVPLQRELLIDDPNVVTIDNDHKIKVYQGEENNE